MPANRVKGPVIRKEIRIEARPETVFRLLTDQAQIVRWKGQKATINPTPGGEYRIVFNEQDVVVGKVVEIDPPRRFVFTWGWEGAGSPVPPGSSTVEITLTPSTQRAGNSTRTGYRWSQPAATRDLIRTRSRVVCRKRLLARGWEFTREQLRRFTHG